MKRQTWRSFVVFSIILVLALDMVCFLHFTPSVHATDVSYQVNNISDLIEVTELGTSHPPWDDAHQWQSTSLYWVGYDSFEDNYYYGTGFRFTAVDVPDGATIDSAVIQFYAAGSTSGTTVNLKLSCEANDNATQFTGTIANFNGKSRTSYVSWLNVESWTDDNWYNSSDISDCVQEVVNRDGWVNGNALIVFVEDNGASTSWRSLIGVEVGPSFTHSAKLLVTYSYVPSEAPEYDYVDSQTDVDSSVDVGTYSSFVAQKATDWTNDSLIEANTNTTAMNDAENFVDANNSDIDSHAGYGTSSNFTAQQDALVAFNDTLTEENVGGSSTTNVTYVGFTTFTASNPTSGSWTLPSGWQNNDFGVFWWYTRGNTKTLTVGNVGLTLKYNASSLGYGRIVILSRVLQTGDTTFAWTSSTVSNTDTIWGTSVFRNVNTTNLFENDSGNPASFANTQSPNPPSANVTTAGGCMFTLFGKTNDYATSVTAPSNYATCGTNESTDGTDGSAGAAYRTDMNAGTEDPGAWTLGGASGDDGYTWTAVLAPTSSESTNYELDYEFSWTTADYNEANEYLCIRTSTYSGTAENLGVDVWDGSWKSISNALTASSWNNISISGNLSSGTIYFRFIGKTETTDANQNTWIIECNLIHTWSVGVNYELDLEEQFTSANFSRTNVELCVRMGDFNTTEDLQLDYWNASSSAWVTVTASLTENDWTNTSVKAYTSNVSVTFTVRFIGTAESGDSERSMWDKDACLLHTWDGVAAGLVATLGQSVLVPAYNALAKGLGFQSSGFIIPTSTGLFWKSLPFQVTGTIKLFESTNMAKAIGFLSSGVISFFSSLSQAMGLLLQPSASIIPSSTNYFSKAMGFQTTNTAQSFSSITMQKALGFLTSEASNLFASLSKALAFGFQPSNSIIPSSTSYLSRALGFQSSALLVPSSVSYFGKALGFQATDMMRAFDSVSMLKGMGFLSTELINIFDFSAFSKEVGFQVLEVQRAENVFPSATTYFWKAIGFQPTNMIKLFDSLGVGKGLGFLQTGTVNVVSSLLKGMGLAFQSSGTIKLWDSNSMLKALGFQSSATVKLFDSTSMLKGLGYLATNAINVFDSNAILKALGFQSANTIIPSSTGYFWKAIGLQPTATIKAYDSSIMQKAIGFLSVGTTNFFSSILRGIELAFTPSGILYPFAYGSSGKETATILVDRFELARVFDNAEMLKALGFRTTGSLNLFDSSAMSKAIGLLTTGTIKFYDASTLLNAKGFLAVDNINVFSTVFRSIAVAFQSSGIIKLWDSNAMMKAIGFQSSDSLRLFDTSLFGKALLFQPTQTINVFAGFQVAKEQLFTILNVFHYEPIYPSASLFENKAIQFSILGELTKLFSSLSSNLGREFFTYNLIQPSAYGSQSKGLQFSLDGLVQFFSDSPMGKAIGFLTTGAANIYSTILRGITVAFQPSGTLNVWDSSSMLKALGFKAYELPVFFDYLGMNKGIRITVFDFLNTGLIHVSDSLTMAKSVFIAFAENLFGNLNIQGLMIPIGQILLLRPGGFGIADDTYEILFGFCFVMLVVVFGYGLSRREKEDETF